MFIETRGKRCGDADTAQVVVMRLWNVTVGTYNNNIYYTDRLYDRPWRIEFCFFCLLSYFTILYIYTSSAVRVSDVRETPRLRRASTATPPGFSGGIYRKILERFVERFLWQASCSGVGESTKIYYVIRRTVSKHILLKHGLFP